MSPFGPIYVAGHRGLAGSAISRALRAKGYDQLLEVGREDLDLRKKDQVDSFFEKEKPEWVIVAAAMVGGIHANQSRPAEFIYDNLLIQNNLIHGSHEHGVKKLLFLGSSCIYPKMAPQPMREESLLSSPLEPTNQPYALAKIAGIEMCRSYRRQYGSDFICAMPTNLYGPGDNFDLEQAHVMPAMMHRFHQAKVDGAPSVTLWGTGSPFREFLHSTDLGEACVFLMENHSGEEIVNVGCGKDITIRELAERVRDVVGYKGELEWDSSRPDGTPRKLMDIERIRTMGWEPRVGLSDGLKETYQWFLDNLDSVRGR
jgi:GDP-L-fucose synthase